MKGEDRSQQPSWAWLHYLLIGVVPIVMAWLYLGALLRAGEPGFPLDDSWIHIRFAENLAAGRGFAFNPGEPSTGATSPLWIVVLAGGLLIMRNPLVAAYVLGVALTIALCVVVYKIALTLLENRLYALVAGVLTALTPPMAWASLSGMEPPLYTFLSLLGIYLYLLSRAGRTRLRYVWPAVLGLAALARPECGLVFVLALIDTWVLDLVRRRPVGPLLLATGLQVGVFAAVLLPDLVRNVIVSGRPFPSTLYAKTLPEGPLSPILSQLQRREWDWLATRVVRVPRDWLVDALQTALNSNPLLLLLLGAGLVEIRRLARSPESRHRSILLPLALIGAPLLMGLLAPVAKPSFQGQRYATHLVPLFTLVGTLGAYRLVGLAGDRPAPSRLRGGLLGLLLALAFAGPLLAPRDRIEDRYVLGVRNINRLQVAAAEWLRDNTAPDAVVAAQDVGAIGVISGRYVLDLGGLVTPEFAWIRYDDALVLEQLQRVQPDYLVILPVDRPTLSERLDLFTPAQAYRIPAEELVTASSNYIVIYRTVWAKG